MVEPKDAQVEPEKQAEAEPEVQPQPTIEELIQEIETRKQEDARKEAEIKRLQGISRDLQKRGISQETVDALGKKIDDMQEWYATVSDDLAGRIAGESFEEQKPSKKSYREQLNDKRAAAKPAETKVAPEVQKFINYLDGQGLDFEDPLVKEAIADKDGNERSPQEALKYLKTKVKDQAQPEIDKLAEEKAKIMVEQKYKELGLTVLGAGAPSAPATSWRDATPEEKILRGVSGKK